MTADKLPVVGRAIGIDLSDLDLENEDKEQEVKENDDYCDLNEYGKKRDEILDNLICQAASLQL